MANIVPIYSCWSCRLSYHINFVLLDSRPRQPAWRCNPCDTPQSHCATTNDETVGNLNCASSKNPVGLVQFGVSPLLSAVSLYPARQSSHRAGSSWILGPRTAQFFERLADGKLGCFSHDKTLNAQLWLILKPRDYVEFNAVAQRPTSCRDRPGLMSAIGPKGTFQAAKCPLLGVKRTFL